MDATVIGLSVMTRELYQEKLGSGDYDAAAELAQPRHLALRALREAICLAENDGIEVLTPARLNEGDMAAWSACCQGVYGLVRVMGWVVKSEKSRIPGWSRVRLRPHFVNKVDMASAERNSRAESGGQGGIQFAFAA